MKSLAKLWTTLIVVTMIMSCQKTEVESPGSAQEEILLGNNSAGQGSSEASRRQPTVTSYAGQATGLNAIIVNTSSMTVTSNQTILAQTRALATTGGTDAVSFANANVENAVIIDALSASTSGQGDKTESKASATNLTINKSGNLITASYVESTATMTCSGGFTGVSTINNLVINGEAIAITGDKNQVVYLRNGGMVIINEHSTAKKGKNGGPVTVTGLHIIMPDGSDIRIASVRAEIKC